MKEDLALQQQMLVNYLLHQVNLNFLGLHVALHAIPSCTYWGFFPDIICFFCPCIFLFKRAMGDGCQSTGFGMLVFQLSFFPVVVNTVGPILTTRCAAVRNICLAG